MHSFIKRLALYTCISSDQINDASFICVNTSADSKNITQYKNCYKTKPHDRKLKGFFSKQCCTFLFTLDKIKIDHF